MSNFLLLLGRGQTQELQNNTTSDELCCRVRITPLQRTAGLSRLFWLLLLLLLLLLLASSVLVAASSVADVVVLSMLSVMLRKLAGRPVTLAVNSRDWESSSGSDAATAAATRTGWAAGRARCTQSSGRARTSIRGSDSCWDWIAVVVWRSRGKENDNCNEWCGAQHEHESH